MAANLPVDDLQTAIPFTLMRGGTSRGPYFLASDLPADPATRDAVLLSAMGSPGQRQIDGIGGNTPLTSKVAIVSPSDHPWADVDYLFAQVAIDRPVVDTKPSCGNMLSGVGPFAIEQGLVPASDGVTQVRIRNVNTGALIESSVQTPGGGVQYAGETAIDGVDGTAAPIALLMQDVVGGVMGSLLPTGNIVDDINGIEITCFDVAMPIVIANATSFGKTGYETEDELSADKEFMQHFLELRQEVASRVGMGDITDSVVPKFAIVSPPREGGTVCSRYFTPWAVHSAYAVTGSICIGCCSALPGSIVHQVAVHESEKPDVCRIEHPSGMIEVSMNVDAHDGTLDVKSAGVVRTARKLMEGSVYVPSNVWDGAS